jgi:hypothetical protein
MTLETFRQPSPFGRQFHDEGAAIRFADCACDQSASCKAIENAG